MKIYVILFLIGFSVLYSACSQKPVTDTNWQLVASGFEFPEGPAWTQNGNLYVSNCYGKWLAKINNGKVDTFLTASDSTFQKTNGLLVNQDGSLLACEYGNGAILKISPDGIVQNLIPGFEGNPFNRPNDLTISTTGKLYFSDPKSYGADNLDGRLFMYDFESKLVQLVVDSLAFPNGMAISPMDNRLYLSESAKNRILRFDISDTGELSNKQVFIELAGGDPDGLEFDVRGNLYVAHFGTGTVFVILPNAEIIQKIQAPGKKPSNLEFGGDDLKTLFLTEDETNAVYKIRTSVRGN